MTDDSQLRDRSEDTPAGPPTGTNRRAAAPGEPGHFAELTRYPLRARDGISLSVIVAAPPSPTGLTPGLPPVLAVHGYASNAAGGWGRTGHLDALAHAGRLVIAPDLRGHGGSDKPHRDEAYTLDQVLTDLIDATRALPGWLDSDTVLDMSCFDVIGYSLGSRLSWTLATRALLPIRRLVLGGFDGRPLFSGTDPTRLDRLAASAAGNDREALAHLVAGLTGSGATTDTAAPDIPVLIVAGTADPLASRAADFAASLPRGRYLAIPDRTHISAVPSRIYRHALVEFLAADDPAATTPGGPIG